VVDTDIKNDDGDKLIINSSPSSGCCIEFLEEHGSIECILLLMLRAYSSSTWVVVFVVGRGIKL
jgi:hypothetical protein